MKLFTTVVMASFAIVLSSCTNSDNTGNSPAPHPALAKIKVVNRAGNNGKEAVATQCIVKTIDGKSVSPGEQAFALMHPGKRRVSFTYQKWTSGQTTNHQIKHVASLRQVCVDAEFKAGGVYWLDVSHLKPEATDGCCSVSATDGQLVYELTGKAKIVEVK